jgi:alanine dehydrogenase
MIIGIPKEIKVHEYRVAIVPAGVRALVQTGHKVYIENGAGDGSGIADTAFQKAGATILENKGEIFYNSDLIMKVKEPLPEEYPLLKKRQIVYSFLHLAASRELLKALLEKEVIAIAYETVQMDDGFLPLLAPMSEIAGRLSVKEGARYLEKEEGGKGLLLGGVPGVEPGKVLIIGGGMVGTNAAKIAIGHGADTTLLELDPKRMAYLDDMFGNRIKTLMSNHDNLVAHLAQADLIIGAVLIPGAKAPKLITREMLTLMRKESVFVDVAIDQGGCAETSKPTSFKNPIYVIDGIIHYCVTNMPSAVARTSTYALTNATLPYAIQLANKGIKNRLAENPALARGLNVMKGKVTHPAIAHDLGYKYYPLSSILN